MDFSLRSVRRPTVLSIPTAPFSFSTPLSSSVRSVDSTLRAFRGPTVAGLAAPFVGYDGIYGLNAGLPVGTSAVFKFLFALLWLSLLLVLCRFLWFYAAFLSLFLFEASLIGSSCLDLHHASYRPRSSFLTASLVMYRLYSGSLTLRSRFRAPF